VVLVKKENYYAKMNQLLPVKHHIHGVARDIDVTLELKGTKKQALIFVGLSFLPLALF